MTATADVPEYSLDRTDLLAPPTQFTELQQEPPSRVRIADGSTPWLLTRHADVRAVLSDPRVSADDTKPGYPRLIPLPPGLLSFVRMDGEDHRRLRQALVPEFTLRRLEALRPKVEQLVEALLDDLSRREKPADLIDAFALPLPSAVISRLLGVPDEDHGFFQAHSRTITAMDESPEAAQAAFGALTGYLHELVGRRTVEPGDDVLSRVAESHVKTGKLTHEELTGMAFLLLLAGHETTAHSLGLGTLLLLSHPEQWEALKADPTLARQAAEEVLRYVPVVHTNISRLAMEDIEIGGVTIATGEGIILALPAANWDEEVFPAAQKFDIQRDSQSNVGFGYGVHQCLGQSLARIELAVAFEGLVRRFPTLQLAAPASELRFRIEHATYGLHELPVTW
ncbi:cytochrome P450 [Kribbella sp. NPDC023972]|uniref:cytochrome P450 n=1 Tax=Kribbella sp. NPDC023972 TaxID=3154795 RepID=UPI00340D28C4